MDAAACETDLPSQPGEAEAASLQERLAALSLVAGQVAASTGALHDVSNLLTSINLAADTLIRRSDTGVEKITRTLAALTENPNLIASFSTEAERSAHYIAFLERVRAVVLKEREESAASLNQICRCIGHIKAIVARPHADARASVLCEEFKPIDVVASVLTVRHPWANPSLQIVQDESFAGTVTADRYQVFQILLNLVTNAEDAMRSTAPDAQILRISVREGPNDHVSDAGGGFDAATKPTLFTFGFTTKLDGHGIGLHHSQVLAEKLGGTLSANSDGRGRGATFTLTFPRMPPRDRGA